jgi:hypothetical protein
VSSIIVSSPQKQGTERRNFSSGTRPSAIQPPYFTDGFCIVLSTSRDSASVIDNQDETLLNGNTYPHIRNLHVSEKEKRFGNNH